MRLSDHAGHLRQRAEIRRLMELARAQGAHIIHFPEAAMSGYTKSQIKSWDDVDWSALETELKQTARLAASLGLWAVIGSAHRLTAPHRPHNSRLRSVFLVL